MHYLQNNWFSSNWFWIICILILSICVVAYLNNKKNLLKQSLIGLTIACVMSFSVSIWQIKLLQANAPGLLPLKQTEYVDPLATESVFTKIVNYVLDIIHDKIAE